MITLGNTIKLGLLYALAVAVIAIGLFAGYQTFQLQTAENAISLQQSTITNQKLAIDGLASEVAFLNNEVLHLAELAELVAALNAEHERQAKLITDTGNDWLVNSNKLQVSEHEPTRTWAAMPLPGDAISMLHDASRSQNGNGQAAGLHSAAIEHGQFRLPATSI